MKSQTSKVLPTSMRTEIEAGGRLVGNKTFPNPEDGVAEVYEYNGSLYYFSFGDQVKSWLIHIYSFDVSELEIFVDNPKYTKELLSKKLH